MISLRLLVIIAAVFVLSVSCEEELVIESKFREAYVLNCVIDANSLYQIATITRTYETKDSFPLENYTDRFVTGADVKILKGQRQFQMKDSVVSIETEPGHTVEIPFYYIDNLNNIIGNELQIIAVLPSGDTLRSTTSVPTMILIDHSRTDIIIPPREKAEDFKVSWNTNELGELYFDARLRINYYTEVNGVLTEHFKDVPIMYEKNGGGNTLIYRAPSYNKYITYSMEFFRKTLSEIAGEVPDKSKCFIVNASLEVITYDKYLTSYYVGTHLLDRFSVRLDEVDYYNIEGGFGVFGSFLKDIYTIAIDPRFIKSAGLEPYF